jgi:hypothetical protein
MTFVFFLEPLSKYKNESRNTFIFIFLKVDTITLVSTAQQISHSDSSTSIII